MKAKFKIKKRRGLSLRKPWELVYPTGESLIFKSFQDVVTQLKLIQLFSATEQAVSGIVYRRG